jgi:hypothetical protein
MPLYYFHIYNDEVTRDEEGQDFPDEGAARDEAVKAARELMCDDVRKGKVTLSDRIVVESDQGLRVLPPGRTISIAS